MEKVRSLAGPRPALQTVLGMIFTWAVAGLVLLAWPHPAQACAPGHELPGLRAALARLIDKGGVAVGEEGCVVYHQGDGVYAPASIIKLATALAAFHTLGADYRFRTEVYRRGDTLYIRGYGDPFLVSEEWALIARALAERGVFAGTLQGLVLDDSAFAPDLRIDGASNSLNPYDAPVGALVSNFNTVFVTVGRNGRVRSAEPQTPLTPLAASLAQGLPPGEERINLTARNVSGLRYSGQLAQAIFAQAGARFRGGSRAGRVPAGLKPLLVHRSSRPLREVVRGMMAFSNNFIANQLVLAMSLERHGEPARLEPGLALERAYLRDTLGLKPDQFTLVEGSGLSRKDRISLEAMLRVVDAFYPWRDLLKLHGPADLRVPAKTGTLTGVYSLAGFLPAPAGVRRPFVIMLNQARRTREPVFRLLASAFWDAPAAAR